MRLPIACVLAVLVACGDDEKTTDTATDTTDTTDTVTTPPTPFETYDEADLTDIDVVQDLSLLSALAMNTRLLTMVQLPLSGSDPACPVVDDTDPNHITVTGGCTEVGGTEWSGSLDIVVSATSYVATFSGFGFSAETDCYTTPVSVHQQVDGTITVDAVAGSASFDLSGVMPMGNFFDCAPRDANFLLEYELSSVGFTGGSVYSGTGRYADDLLGTVDLQTIGEVDALCAWEADSGVTLLTTSAHQAAITYDGAIDCDDPGTATWSLDGAAQGEILGVQCSSTPAAAGWLALAPLAALIRRRR